MSHSKSLYNLYETDKDSEIDSVVEPRVFCSTHLLLPADSQATTAFLVESFLDDNYVRLTDEQARAVLQYIGLPIGVVEVEEVPGTDCIEITGNDGVSRGLYGTYVPM